MRRHLPLLLTFLVAPLVVTWPLARVGGREILAARDQEAATHIWGLWAAIEEGQPLLLRTPLLAWPSGVELPLVDSGNLPWFALGLPLGLPAAYSAVILAGVLLMGLAGALLAREVGGRAWVGALVAMACPTLVANIADGQTEGFAVGLVGIQLACLLRFVRTGRPAWGAAAALALAWAWHAGPYNGLWGSALDAAVGLGLLWGARAGAGRAPLGRALAVGLAALILTLPLAWAVLTARHDTLPGSGSRAGLPRIVENPSIYRGGIQTGADLLDAWVPGWLTGSIADPSHTTYLGAGLVCIGILAVARERRLWPWLAGLLACVLVSWGPWLYVMGEVPRPGGRPLMGPVGALVLTVEPLGRVTRWYRAGAVATLLLAPLVARAYAARPRGVLAGLGLSALVAVELTVNAPLAWPLVHHPLPDAAALLELPEEGALLELPPATTGDPPLGRWRDRVGLTQPRHGRPVGGTIMNLPPSAAALEAQTTVKTLMRLGRLDAEDHAAIQDAGFRYLALYPAYRPLPAPARAQLEACLGAPAAESDEILVFDLGAPGHPRSCGAGPSHPREPRGPLD